MQVVYQGTAAIVLEALKIIKKRESHAGSYALVATVSELPALSRRIR
jgi:hypothetical protein